MWINLLDNAVKFTGTNGKIAIRLCAQEGFAEFVLTDNGRGMDDETLAHLFDRFFQGDKSHSQEGSGLGLALAKRITALCGATISVQSRLGEGSAFTVRLPLDDKPLSDRM